MRRSPFIIPLLLCCFLLAACNRTVTIQGRVLDIQGEELPGVAITVTNAPYEDLTDGLGEYTLRCIPGELQIDYLKSGYTPGRVIVRAGDGDEIAAPDVVLWRLPERPGVYLHKDFRYTETFRVEPKRFKVKSGGQVFATKNTPELLVEEQLPQLISYKLPPFDAQIYRMERVAAQQPDLTGDVFSEEVWAPVEIVPVLPAPIDQPEQLLLELQLQRPLEYGTYAVHWGALNGHKEHEPYIYMFRVIDPEEEARIRAEMAEEIEAETQRRREIAESVEEEEE